jgi:hypothetical protein
MYQKVLKNPELVQRSLSIGGVVACSVQRAGVSRKQAIVLLMKLTKFEGKNAITMHSCTSDEAIYR